MSAGGGCWDRCVQWSDRILRVDQKQEVTMRGNHLVNGHGGNHLSNGVGNGHPGNHQSNHQGNHQGNGKLKSNGHVQSEYL